MHMKSEEKFSVARSRVFFKSASHGVVHYLLKVDVDRDHDIVSLSSALDHFFDGESIGVVGDLVDFIGSGQKVVVLIL